MRYYECFKYHLINNKLVANSNTACWAGLNKPSYLGKIFILIDISNLKLQINNVKELYIY